MFDALIYGLVHSRYSRPLQTLHSTTFNSSSYSFVSANVFKPRSIAGLTILYTLSFVFTPLPIWPPLPIIASCHKLPQTRFFSTYCIQLLNMMVVASSDHSWWHIDACFSWSSTTRSSTMTSTWSCRKGGNRKWPRPSLTPSTPTRTGRRDPSVMTGIIQVWLVQLLELFPRYRELTTPNLR